MAVLRLFAAARVSAGTSRDLVSGETVEAALADAVAKYGPAFEDVLASSVVWLNGEPARPEQAVSDADEIAVLPPVSGGVR